MTLILLRSPAGGVGTTFLTAQLAKALAGRGHDVSAVDATTSGALKLFFEVAPAQTLETLDADATPDAVAGVQLFRADARGDAQALTEQLLARSSAGHVCLVDLGTVPTESRADLLPHAALEIVPLAPTPVSLAGLTHVDGDKPVLALDRTVFVLNQVDDRRRLSNDIHKLLRALLGEQLLGTVRRDEAVNDALAAMKPLATFAPASAALHDVETLVDRLVARIALRPSDAMREVAA